LEAGKRVQGENVGARVKQWVIFTTPTQGNLKETTKSAELPFEDLEGSEVEEKS